MPREKICKAVASGHFGCKYAGVDRSFGDDREFLDSPPGGIVCYADIHKDRLVFRGRPEMIIPGYPGRGRKPGPAP
jgi:hypothetical protein